MIVAEAHPPDQAPAKRVKGPRFSPEERDKFRLEWSRLRQNGWTDSDIARRYGVSRSLIGLTLGPSGKAHEAGGLRLSGSDEVLRPLRRIAHELGYVTDRGRYMGDGSATQLIEAIARGEVELTRRSTPADSSQDPD